jgi:hypothetical protein
MSASNEWTEWHLTPDGWVRGTEKQDFVGRTERERPQDTLLTVVWKEYLSSSFSRMERYHQEVWRSENEALISELIGIYGKAPERL